MSNVDNGTEVRHLKSIQVFAAVAELRSISLAAKQLHLSQSSVSYHIKVLEQSLGIRLFRRVSEGMFPTLEGEKLLPFVREGLQQIHMGIQKISDAAKKDNVKIAMPPMFASRWLAPRLGDFWSKHPNIELSFIHDENLSILGTQIGNDLDLAVQWGLAGNEDDHLVPLISEQLVVVCSPELLKANPLHSVEDLKNHTLLHVDNHRMWEEWLKQAGADPLSFKKSLMMTDRHFQLSATLNGVGVSLLLRAFVQDEIESGKLVRPFGFNFSTKFAYWLVSADNNNPSENLATFKKWLVRMAAQNKE